MRQILQMLSEMKAVQTAAAKGFGVLRKTISNTTKNKTLYRIVPLAAVCRDVT